MSYLFPFLLNVIVLQMVFRADMVLLVDWGNDIVFLPLHILSGSTKVIYMYNCRVVHHGSQLTVAQLSSSGFFH